MRSVNKVILIGNLTRDPEMKKTLQNQVITTFGLATNREWVTKDGRKQQSAEFHDLVCWGRLAEFAAQYLKKGKLIHVEGHLKTRSWDDAQGVKKFRTEIVVEDLIMLDRRPKEEEQEKSDLKIPVEAHGFSAAEPHKESLQPSVTMDDFLTI
ncbi:MAG: single-stranded DNA-binding protein [Patescibacteria group bacterium]